LEEASAKEANWQKTARGVWYRSEKKRRREKREIDFEPSEPA